MKEYLANDYLMKDCPYWESNCSNNKNDDKLDCICPKFKAYIDVQNPEIIKQELQKMNITATEKMDVMLSMQKIFASKFHNTENLSKKEIDYWTNSYLVCIEDELVEAEEYLDIYLDKVKDFNLKEFRKELIDIVHFMMDGMIVSGMTYNDLKDKYSKKYKFSNNNYDLLDISMKDQKVVIEQISDENQYLYLLNYLLRDIRLVRQCISWKHWKKASDTINKDDLFNAYEGMYENLVRLFVASGMTSDDVYDVYIHKNVENCLRQKYGYLIGDKNK